MESGWIVVFPDEQDVRVRAQQEGWTKRWHSGFGEPPSTDDSKLPLCAKEKLTVVLDQFKKVMGFEDRCARRTTTSQLRPH